MVFDVFKKQLCVRKGLLLKKIFSTLGSIDEYLKC